MAKIYAYILVSLLGFCLPMTEAPARTAEPSCVCAKEQVLTLEDIFALAEDNEIRLQLSRSAAEIASLKVKESKEAILPDISANLSANYIGNGILTDRDFSNVTVAPIPHFGNNFAFEATQLLYAGGARNAAAEMAEIGERIAGKELELTRQQVRMLLAGYYLDLFRMRNQRVVYMRNCELMERLVELGKSRESHGTALRNDVTRYELQLADMRLALDNVETEASVLNYRLCTMLGLDADMQIGIDTTIISDMMPRGLEAEWMSRREDTPSVGIALSGEEMAEAQLRLARSEMMPKLALTFADNMNGPVLIEVPPLNNNFNYWYVGIGVSIDLGALYKSPSKVRQARAGVVRSRQSAELARRETDMNIQAAYRRYSSSFSELEKQVKSVELAAENYRIINNRYENGLAIVTDMVDAANMKLSAELAEVDARIRVAYLYCQLRYEAGIL